MTMVFLFNITSALHTTWCQLRLVVELSVSVPFAQAYSQSIASEVLETFAEKQSCRHYIIYQAIAFLIDAWVLPNSLLYCMYIIFRNISKKLNSSQTLPNFESFPDSAAVFTMSAPTFMARRRRFLAQRRLARCRLFEAQWRLIFS